MSKIKELLCVNEDEIDIVRRMYNKSENDIQEDINLLLEWLKKQPHLPKQIDRVRLERFLLRNKFRIEQTKIKLDNYYSFKVFYSNFYTHLDPESHVIQNLRKSIIITLIPKLLPDSQRIFYFDFVKNQEENFSYLDSVQYFIMLWEFQLWHDYNASDVFVMNARNLTFKHVMKMDPNIVYKSFYILQHGFSGRLAQLNYVNVSPSLELLMVLLKRTLNAKLFEKIVVHPDYDSLHQTIPKDYLPEEAQGNLGSAEEMNDKWIQEMILQKELLTTTAGETSNEELRMGKSIHSDLFGVEGTFRKINID